MQKTFSPKSAAVIRSWHQVDASGKVVGRLASQLAKLLMGKDKIEFARHIDSGDQVVVLNVEKIKFTGLKETQKLYRRHSGYGGGFKELNAQQVREAHPDRLLLHAVSGMLPKNKLRPKMLTRLHLIAGPVNPYEQHFQSQNS